MGGWLKKLVHVNGGAEAYGLIKNATQDCLLCPPPLPLPEARHAWRDAAPWPVSRVQNV